MRGPRNISELNRFLISYMSPSFTPPSSPSVSSLCLNVLATASETGASRGKRPVLTQEQRRLHHIRSEQRRRLLLREELYKLYDLVPNAANDPIDSMLHPATHGRSLNLSEATIIRKGLWCHSLSYILSH